jgi:hypothetical protein
VVLALLAAAIAVWARHRIFPALSWNRDEAVYLWQVEALRDGHLTSTDGGHPELFLPWLSGDRGGVMFTQYTLGWPLVLLASVVITGSPTAALGFGAFLAVLGVYAFAWEIRHERPIAVGAALVMVASPVLPIQGGVHLSYLFTLGLGLLFGAGLLSGIRARRPARLVGAGVLLGWIFFTRPYDAVLWGLAITVYAVVSHRDRWRDLVSPFATCAAGAVPLVVVTLAYNRHVTGSLLDFPIVVVDPMDTFGFGHRRLMPRFPEVDYTAGSGLRAMAKHAFFVPWFLAGSYVALVLAAVGLWVGRRERATLAVVLVAAVFPLGYFPFWGTEVSSYFTRLSGPLYYLPLFAAIAILVATVVTRLHERHRPAAVALVVALVLATVPAARSRFIANHDLSAPQDAWRSSVDSIDGRAIVFVGDANHYLTYANPFSRNNPELDDRILYAVDGQPEMLDLIAEHPDRTPYLQLATIGIEDRGPKEDPLPFTVRVLPVEVDAADAFTLAVEAGDPGDAAVVAVEVRLGYSQIVRRTVPAGQPLPTFRVAAPGHGPADIQLTERGQLSIRVGYGDDEADALERPTAREDVLFRVVDGTAEVLFPTAKLESVTVGQTWQWRRQVTLTDLHVDLRPEPPAR